LCESLIVNAKNSFRITRKTRFLEKKPVFRTFPEKTFIILRDYIDALPHIIGAPCCNKVSENEKTAGNRYKMMLGSAPCGRLNGAEALPNSRVPRVIRTG
jgi:hypothetical protein